MSGKAKRPQTAFECMSPLDYRYWDSALARHLSEDAFVRCKLEVECALVKVLVDRSLCPREALAEVETSALGLVTTEAVYVEEGRIGHDIRALVNCIQQCVSEETRPFVHMTATSYDVVDTANAARFRAVVGSVLLPALEELAKTLRDLTLREADTVQIGRTHGQHAVPVTLGFTFANYLDRIGSAYQHLRDAERHLVGKFSGAVGAYNASTLFFEDPEEFERTVLGHMKLRPARISTQVVPPEPMVHLMSSVVTAAGVMANIATDLRHLQRTEIGEVYEDFGAQQVGSSTMPQKRNPINLENVVSLWKVVVARMTTVYLDQVSEHQRDLTNSASQRTYGEIIGYTVSMAKRLNRTLGALRVDQEAIARNLNLQLDLVLAEPLYILLAAQGHPDAHEAVRALTLKAQQEGRKLMDLAREVQELQPFLARLSPAQKRVLEDPAAYTGIAAQKARSIAAYWADQFIP